MNVDAIISDELRSYSEAVIIARTALPSPAHSPSQRPGRLSRLKRLERRLGALERQVADLSPPDAPLTARQAALYLNTTVPGIYGLVRRRTLKKLAGSKNLRFRKAELDRYLETRPEPKRTR